METLQNIYLCFRSTERSESVHALSRCQRSKNFQRGLLKLWRLPSCQCPPCTYQPKAWRRCHVTASFFGVSSGVLMRILFVYPMPADGDVITGNLVTAQRIAGYFQLAGHHVRQVGTHVDPASVDQRTIDLVIGLHLLKCAAVITSLSSDMKVVMILGGTDVSTHHKDAASLSVMTAVATRCQMIVAFTASVEGQFRSIWPQFSSKTRVIHPAIDVKMSKSISAMKMTTTTTTTTLTKKLLAEYPEYEELLPFVYQPTGLRNVKDPGFLVAHFGRNGGSQQQQQLKLIIAGPTLEEECARAFAALVQSNSPRVHYLGCVSHERSLALMRLATVVLNTSVNEGCSNAIVEAMHVGAVVVARRNPGNVALISHGSNGFLYDSPLEACRLAQTVFDDEGLRVRIEDGARRYANKQHSADNEAAGYLNLLLDASIEKSGAD